MYMFLLTEKERTEVQKNDTTHL